MNILSCDVCGEIGGVKQEGFMVGYELDQSTGKENKIVMWYDLCDLCKVTILYDVISELLTKEEMIKIEREMAERIQREIDKNLLGRR